ncbi:response regulator transcription factor [Blastococcus sp. SYSU D00669]
MPGDVDHPVRSIPQAVLRVDADGEPPLRVTIVCGNPRHRRQLAALLARTPGVEAEGWAESAAALSVLEEGSAVVVRPAVAPASPRPLLAPRQQEVLVAYASGNELLATVARTLGMNAETFKTHLRRIRAKYQAVGRPAPTRRDLYVRAVEDGPIPPPS